MAGRNDDARAAWSFVNARWKLRIAVLLVTLAAGCNQDKGKSESPRASGSERVILAVPPGYKIVNETQTLLILRADRIRVTIFRMAKRDFQIRKANRSQMAADVRTTQFGDRIVPASRFEMGQTAGWKFAIQAKNTGKTRVVEYLLGVDGGYVQVDIERDDYEPFDEAAIEPLLASIRVAAGEPLAGAYHEMYGRKREYELTKGLARLRIFADNYQFVLYDFEANPFEPLPEINKRTSEQGWTRTQHALWIFTRAHGNDHRIDVRLSARYDPDPAAMRQTVFNLRLPTGTLALFEHPEHVRFRVPPGDYMIYCRAYNLGSEGDSEVELPDDEFFKHDEWERYEVVLVRGVADREGPL